MAISVTYSQFLSSNGVQREQANTIGAKIASKISKRETLTHEESALTVIFLNRPGANKIAERHMSAAILTSNVRGAVDNQIPRKVSNPRRPATPGVGAVVVGESNRSSGRVPAHTPEWHNPRPGDPGNTQLSTQSWAYETEEINEGGAMPSDVRKLAARVAASFASAGSGTPTV